MAKKADQEKFDFFVPYVQDLSIKDQRETMERPFFSLSKNKRLKPIEYNSPDGSVFVNIQPHQDYGMATIWDADILIWAVSTLQSMKNNGKNDIPRTLNFHPHTLLKAIQRETGGKQYQDLRDALGRLHSTIIRTNIRANGRKKYRQFNWLESWSDMQVIDEESSKGMSITLADWVYEGVLMKGGVLSIGTEYFSIKGGRDRWLYRVARKHAGGAGKEGFKISFTTLFEKSGAEGTYRAFKHFIKKTAKENMLPGFDLKIEDDKKKKEEPFLRITCRENFEKNHTSLCYSENNNKALSQEALTKIRKDFPGWDLRSLENEFNEWLANNPEKKPDNYEKAFYGFVRQYNERNKHYISNY